MIDIHSHLLPGVDDGSPSFDVSVTVLERFAREGLDVLVCTPHLNASAVGSAPVAEHRDLLDELIARAPERPALRAGWEIMLDEPGADFTAPHLGLGGSTAVLVEFPRAHVPERSAQELFRIRMSGLVPVVAHPERYWGCTLDQIREWRHVGAVIQLDGAGLLGSAEMARLARDMLQEGLVDCIASDNHGDRRSLAATRTWLMEQGATEQAELLTHTNAERLLANEPVLPVPPLPVEPGLFGRLKQLLLRRGTSGT